MKKIITYFNIGYLPEEIFRRLLAMGCYHNRIECTWEVPEKHAADFVRITKPYLKIRKRNPTFKELAQRNKWPSEARRPLTKT